MENESKVGLFKGMLVALLIEGTILAIVAILIKIFQYIFRNEVIYDYKL